MLKKWLRKLSPVLVIAFGFGVFALLQANKPIPEKKEPQARILQVYTTPAHLDTTVFDVYAQGEVKAKTRIELAAQVGGRIEWVSNQFIAGGNVKAGNPLLQIEKIDYELALSQAEAALANARVLLEKAEADANVARQQLAGVKNPSPLALKIPQVKEAKANVKAAEASLARAQLNLDRTTISLPYDARISATRAEVGQYIAPGQSLASIFGVDEVMVRLALKQDELASLGLPIGFNTTDYANAPRVIFSADIANRHYQWEGFISHIEASIDESTRMVHAIARLPSPYDSANLDRGMPMAVGLYVNAKIGGKQADSIVAIPRAALRPGDRVFVISAGALDIREVEVAHSNDEKAYIESGIQEGELVVTSPIRNPIRGMALASIEANAVEASE